MNETSETSTTARYVVTIDRVRVVTIPDNDSEPERDTADNYLGCTPAEIAQYVAADNARADAFDDGEWSYVGVRAEAILTWHLATHPDGWANRVKITSAGLWGIETDSGDDYLASEGDAQLDELADLLRAILPADQVDAAIAAARPVVVVDA